MSTELAKVPVLFGPKGIELRDIEGLWRFANAVAKSGLAPKGIQTPEAIFVAVEMGLEVGLPPMAALQNIAVINGRPALYGDTALGIVRGTGELEEFDEWYEARGERLSNFPTSKDVPDDVVAVCQIKRRGYRAQRSTFSIADAKRAGLWGKQGPWTEYPQRMLKWRARSFGLRDQFSDALRGIANAEELMDRPAIDVDATAVPVPRPLFEEPVLARPAEATAPAPPEAPKGGEELQTAVGPKTQAGGAGIKPQDQLTALVTELGYSYDDLRRCAEANTWPVDLGAFGGFADLTEKETRFLLRNKAGLGLALKTFKGQLK
jgi:hypothetical protein